MICRMDKGFLTQSPARWLVGLAAIGAMWWIAFEQSEQIPVLTYVNLGIHQAGHMFTYSASELTTAMAGSIAQVAIPLLIALYFFLRGDWVGAGVCSSGPPPRRWRCRSSSPTRPRRSSS